MILLKKLSVPKYCGQIMANLWSLAQPWRYGRPIPQLLSHRLRLFGTRQSQGRVKGISSTQHRFKPGTRSTGNSGCHELIFAFRSFWLPRYHLKYEILWSAKWRLPKGTWNLRLVSDPNLDLRAPSWKKKWWQSSARQIITRLRHPAKKWTFGKTFHVPPFIAKGIICSPTISSTIAPFISSMAISGISGTM